jgi:hypothetical protein
MLRKLVPAKVVPSSPILVTLIMEAIPSTVMSVLTRATWSDIPQDGIVQIYINLQLMGGPRNTKAIVPVPNQFLDKCGSVARGSQASCRFPFVFSSDGCGTEFILYVVFILCTQGEMCGFRAISLHFH